MGVSLNTLLLICPLVFLAGFVDSIAGGGGLISLPSYLLVGLPVHMAYGTNKFSSSFGTAFSAARFIKSRQVDYKSVIASVPAALLGSYGGARLALFLDDKILRYSLLFLLPIISVFILTRRNFGQKASTPALSGINIILLSIISGGIIGAYDGFFGPGAGTLLILMYTGIIGFDFTTASGNAKVVNLASNIAALFTFIMGGQVMFAVAIPAAAFGILGNWIGSGLAIKRGTRIIRPVFVGVLVLLFVKVSFDLIR